METKVEEYIRKVSKLMKSKLNGLVKAVNTWGISLLRYSETFVNWTKAELAKQDRTRKEFSMNGVLYPRREISRLYLHIKESGRRLISVEDCVKLTRKYIDSYIGNSEEILLKAARDIANSPGELKKTERRNEYI